MVARNAASFPAGFATAPASAATSHVTAATYPGAAAATHNSCLVGVDLAFWAIWACTEVLQKTMMSSADSAGDSSSEVQKQPAQEIIPSIDFCCYVLNSGIRIFSCGPGTHTQG